MRFTETYCLQHVVANIILSLLTLLIWFICHNCVDTIWQHLESDPKPLCQKNPSVFWKDMVGLYEILCLTRVNFALFQLLYQKFSSIYILILVHLSTQNYRSTSNFCYNAVIGTCSCEETHSSLKQRGLLFLYKACIHFLAARKTKSMGWVFSLPAGFAY